MANPIGGGYAGSAHHFGIWRNIWLFTSPPTITSFLRQQAANVAANSYPKGNQFYQAPLQ